MAAISAVVKNAAFWWQATSMRGGGGSASSSISLAMLNMMAPPPSLAGKPGGWVMIDIRPLRPQAKTIGARRKTQQHLDCLIRQIAARAGRQATPVKVRSRARRLSSPRLYHRELVDRLAFERWVELNMIACRLAMQEHVIGAFQHRDREPVQHPAI